MNVLTGQTLGPTLARLGFAAVLGGVFYLLRRTSGLPVIPMLVDGPLDVASLVSAPPGERRVASSGAGALSPLALIAKPGLVFIPLDRLSAWQ